MATTKELTDFRNAHDRAWFSRTCRAVARAVCPGRPDLWEDAEAEARVRAWLSYRAGYGRPYVARAARTGAWLLWRAQCFRTVADPATGRQRCVPGGRADLSAARLSLTGPDGAQYDNPALYGPEAFRAEPPGSGQAAVLSRLWVEAALSRLPAGEAALVARLIGGESQGQVAAEAGVTQQAVAKRFRRAAGRLRGALGD